MFLSLMMSTRLFGVAVILASASSFAQTPATVKEIRDVLTLDATVTATIQPDTAVVVLAAEKQGTDAAALTNEVNQILARALTEAKAVAGVQASTGAYNTQPRYDNKGQRNGWMVRAELVLKAKDFGVLGTLAGKLSKDLQIASNASEISPALRDKEEAVLIDKAIAAFRAKAAASTKAFGYANFTIREVAVGQIGGGMPVQPKQMMMARGAVMAADAAAMPVEPGARELSLTVSGSVQMAK
jgi:predicted secreted protein